MNEPLIDPAPLEFSETQLATDPILRFFHYGHLPLILQAASKPFCDVAVFMIEAIPRNAERTVALRKLLEAKDAAVRANLPPHMPIPKTAAIEGVEGLPAEISAAEDEDRAKYIPSLDRSTDGIAAAIEETSDKLG